ncbi:MAG: DUF72 domain-containing protein [Nitrososphaerota archaeon]
MDRWMTIRVGCCGWAVRGGRQAYFKTFETIEVQETFYRVPKLETLERMRGEAPEGFVFNMKAWQVITHPHTSPTWRRMKPPPGNPSRYGLLKHTRENLRAWEKVVEMADALRPRVVVIQTPPSFGFSERNIENVNRFFSQVSGSSFAVGWEPRGSWTAKTEIVEKICTRHGVIHITDLLRRKPTPAGPVVYTRLHGLGGGEVNYSYRYSDEDLVKLKELISELRWRETYVMFNNVSMAADAARFKELVPS